MIDPNAIRQQGFMQPIGEMLRVTQEAVTSQTKTTQSIPEIVKQAKSQGTEKTHPAAKQAAATIGALIGKALSPFVFNEGKAKAELSKAFSGVNFESADNETLKSMRNDMRTVQKIANRYDNKHGDGVVLGETLHRLTDTKPSLLSSLDTKRSRESVNLMTPDEEEDEQPQMEIGTYKGTQTIRGSNLTESPSRKSEETSTDKKLDINSLRKDLSALKKQAEHLDTFKKQQAMENALRRQVV